MTKIDEKVHIKPFLKWVGGKAKLVDTLDGLMRKLVNTDHRLVYVEPFVGGGAVLCHMLNTWSNLHGIVINDKNERLVDCYRTIQGDMSYMLLEKKLKGLENLYNKGNAKNVYLDIRNKFNQMSDAHIFEDEEMAEQSAMFIFLNKTCFNGMYRVNRKGEYNVPWGTKETVSLFDKDNLKYWHIYLKNTAVEMFNGDYSVMGSIAFAPSYYPDLDVLYYLDPPYRPISLTSAFTSYTKDSFTDKDQEELKKFCDNVTSNPRVHIIESNSKSGRYFDELYHGYDIMEVAMRRNINCAGDKRGPVKEILIYK